MSAGTQPISSTRFAAALSDLPLENLHSKAAELQNSIAHLQRSNVQLEPYASEGDADCTEAIRENDEVIARQRERIQLLRREVERRGFRWAEGAEEAEEGTEEGRVGVRVLGINGVGGVDGNRVGTGLVEGGERQGEQRPGGSLSDEDLTRRLAAQMEEDGDGDGDGDAGMHL